MPRSLVVDVVNIVERRAAPANHQGVRFSVATNGKFTVATNNDRGPVRIGGPCVSRGAQAGGVRPLPPPATRRYLWPRAPLRGAASYEAEG